MTVPTGIEIIPATQQPAYLAEEQALSRRLSSRERQMSLRRRRSGRDRLRVLLQRIDGDAEPLLDRGQLFVLARSFVEPLLALVDRREQRATLRDAGLRFVAAELREPRVAVERLPPVDRFGMKLERTGDRIEIG